MFVLVIMFALALDLAPVVVAILPVMALGVLATSVSRARGEGVDASV